MLFKKTKFVRIIESKDLKEKYFEVTKNGDTVVLTLTGGIDAAKKYIEKTEGVKKDTKLNNGSKEENIEKKSEELTEEEKTYVKKAVKENYKLMPLFNKDSICPKCGNDESVLSQLRRTNLLGSHPFAYTTENKAYYFYSESFYEYINRRCLKCGCEWDERPLDVKIEDNK